jgi:hypothetical protein
MVVDTGASVSFDDSQSHLPSFSQSHELSQLQSHPHLLSQLQPKPQPLPAVVRAESELRNSV